MGLPMFAARVTTTEGSKRRCGKSSDISPRI
jgi:hypothetical protein